MRRSEREFRDKDAMRMAAATDYAMNPYKVGAFARLEKADEEWDEALDQLLLDTYLDGHKHGASNRFSA